MTVSIALYQPDIAGNTGTLMRFGACMGVDIEIIEPAGFDLSDRSLKRAGMDYLDAARLIRHLDFSAFDQARRASGRRLVLLTTKASEDYRDFAFGAEDILLFGRESAGVPDHVHQTADERLTIPMAPGTRSLNLAVSAAMVTGEALRQLRRPLSLIS
ncbi:tRNA (cytidine(34)-2'-O)-methyltransferase [Aureimonas mangrovi]|uniref:tRNA (cytidine(34)-2'-O)-methyltransferase n=1 Tax=Aureimonas mangrovi TaxID=2758041 RepID=UPI00163D7535|nr:tRNA (cytidine(34)-2'-O)-methyltransferase [Aureimonas mangrovi]